MYSTFYGLSEPPFEPTFNPRFVYHTVRHREARSHLENGLLSGIPLTVLLGAPGTGKTTLVQSALRSERCRHGHCVYLTASTGTRERLVDMLLAELDPHTPQDTPAGAPLQRLHTLLTERRSRGLLTALALDEAERLNDERLAELCDLVTLQDGNAQLLPLLLAGQPGLDTRLGERGLGPLQVRAWSRCELAPLDLSQSAAYILWRAGAAGAQGGTLFTREAVKLIHEQAEGIPRTINVICDNALLTGMFRKQKPVTRGTVSEVCQQLDSRGGPTPRLPRPLRLPA